MQRILIISLVSAIVFFPVGFSNADIFIDGTTTGAALGNGVLVSALTVAGPSDFSNELMVWTSTEPTKTTSDGNAVTLSELDLIEIAGSQYLRLALDLQEINNKEQVTITDLKLDVYDADDTLFITPVTVWEFANVTNGNIVINDDATTAPGDLTITPLGNGADVAFYIPRSIFDGTNFIGADKLKVTVAGPDDRENGSEEFVLYTGADGVYLGAGDLVGVPEPGSAILFVAAFGIMLRRRRNGS